MGNQLWRIKNVPLWRPIRYFAAYIYLLLDARYCFKTGYMGRSHFMDKFYEIVNRKPFYYPLMRLHARTKMKLNSLRYDWTRYYG